MKIKHLITSGCSFSDNVYVDGGRWPHFLSKKYDLKLYNFGHGSAGNDYISESIIFKIHDLLTNGIHPSEIAVFVMWSGIDRQNIFISKSETIGYDNFINMMQNNPINFLYMIDRHNTGCFTPGDYSKEGYPPSGWLFGSPGCYWHNENIRDLKQLYFEKFYTYENCLINSMYSFLKLQWLCESKNIYIRNMTFMNILNQIEFENVKHLYDMIDFSKWFFWKERDGLFEYTKDNNLPFYEDGFHPLPESHLHFVENYICPKLW